MGSGPSGSRRQTLRCTGPGGPPVAPVAAATARHTVLRQNGGRPVRTTGAGRSASYRVAPAKMPGCVVVWFAPVPRSSCGRSALTTRSGTSPWEASRTAGCRFATAVPDVVTTAAGTPAAAGQAQGEEAGAALVDPDVQPEPPRPLRGEHRVREGSGP